MIFLCLNLKDEEKDLIEIIYKGLYDKMKRRAITILKDENKAEEALSNSFFKIIKNIKRFWTFLSGNRALLRFYSKERIYKYN